MATPETNTREHLEESILLAYLRRQQLEDGSRLRISQHIDIERCPRCRHKLDELAQVSATLDVLGRMRSYQHYPEMPVDDTYARIQRAASKQAPLQGYLHRINAGQRPRKSAVRLVSLPAAIVLTIVFTVIVFAGLSGRSWISGSSKGGVSHSQPNIPLIVPAHSTPNLALTATASADASATARPTPTATPITGPYIEVCSTPSNIARLRLVICGHNFEAGYKMILAAFGKTLTWLPNLGVNRQGYFQVGWNIGSCVNLPTTIIAYERTNSKPIIARLQNIAFGSCRVPAHRTRSFGF